MIEIHMARGFMLLLVLGICASESGHAGSAECNNEDGRSVSTVLEDTGSSDGDMLRTHSWWRYLLFPFRHKGTQVTNDPCGLGLKNCFSKTASPSKKRELSDSADAVALVRTRADWGGPLAHHWLEIETSKSKRTIGFGPATIPFIDTGQIDIHDEYGNTKRISGTHPLPFLTLPARKRNYSKGIGVGKEVGKPFQVPLDEADKLIRSESRKKHVFLYIPLFNDCRTYVCKLKAKLQGKSGIWCYLFFKGYW